ncbi:unnamed protein product [Arabidopsis lyrata]|nr:unnamed protein product [Arabidopsis lyrata]
MSSSFSSYPSPNKAPRKISKSHSPEEAFERKEKRSSSNSSRSSSPPPRKT